MTRPRKTTLLIGHCGVDSGQLLIIDPCYIKNDFDVRVEFTDDASGEARVSNAHLGGYPACCAATFGPTGAGEAADGVAFSSGYGDGYYPVYATYNEEGVIAKVEVIMDERADPYNPEQEYDDDYEEEEECAD